MKKTVDPVLHAPPPAASPDPALQVQAAPKRYLEGKAGLVLFQRLEHFLFEVVAVHATTKSVARAQRLLDLGEERPQKGYGGLAVVYIPRSIVQPQEMTAFGQKSRDRIVARHLAVMRVVASGRPADLGAGAQHRAVDVDGQRTGVQTGSHDPSHLLRIELPQRLHRRCAETLEFATHAAVTGKMLEATKPLEQAIALDKLQMMQAPPTHDQQPQDHPAQGHHAEVASVDHGTQMPAHPGIEPDASQIADQNLQTRIRGHAFVAELDGDIAVDTALKIGFLSSHSRWPFVGLTGKAWILSNKRNERPFC